MAVENTKRKQAGHRATPRGAVSASVRASRRSRSVYAVGLLVSVAIHSVLFLLGSGTIRPVDSAGATSTDDEPEGGGGVLVALRVAQPRDIEVPPRPQATIAVLTPAVEVNLPYASVGGPAALPAAYPGAPGRARGEGTGGESGTSTLYVAPVPRSIVPQWDAPARVKGMRVTVRVLVNAHGLPTGEVELVPPTPDRAFNRRLIEGVQRMAYHPARRAGEPVPGWAEITFVF